jgi:transaldolase
VKHVASVASFFVSRIDALVDPLLEKLIAQGGKEADLAKKAHGQVAIASAKMAYQIYKEIFGSDRFRNWPPRALVSSGCSGPAPAPRTRTTAT